MADSTKKHEQETVEKNDSNTAVSEFASPPQNIWWQRGYPVLVLMGICLIATLLLSVTNSITAPIIENNNQGAEQEAMRVLFSDADDFVSLDIPSAATEFASQAYIPMSGEDALGYLILTASKGYGGDVPIIVSFDTEGVLLAITIGVNSETVGIGDRIYDEAFLNSFVGLTTQLAPEDYVAISGATYSAGAVNESVGKALEAVTLIITESEE